MAVKKRKKSRSKDKFSLVAMGPQAVFAAGFVVLSVALVILLAGLLSPFIKSLIWAAVLAIMMAPVFKWVMPMVGRRRTVASLATTTLFVALVVGPGFFLGSTLIQEGVKAKEGFQSATSDGGLAKLNQKLKDIPLGTYLEDWGFDADTARRADGQIRSAVAKVAQEVGELITVSLASFAKNFLLFAFNLFVVTIALFFFLREGGVWLRKAKDSVPLDPGVRDLILNKFSFTVTAVVHGLFFTALLQGLTLALGFKIFGMPFPVLLAILGFMFALVPLLGTIFVWAPCVAWLYLMKEDSGSAMGLLIYCGFIINFLDYVLKPWIIGDRAKLPTLFLLLSILGGVKAYGMLGLFLGPVLLAVAIAVGGVYRSVTKRA